MMTVKMFGQDHGERFPKFRAIHHGLGEGSQRVQGTRLFQEAHNWNLIRKREGDFTLLPRSSVEEFCNPRDPPGSRAA